jgi:hypothetical protein
LLESNNKNLSKPKKILTILFWILISSFITVFIVIQIILSPLGPHAFQEFAGTIAFPFITIFITLTISIIFLIFVVRENLEKIFKSYLVLTGISAAGFSLTILLHTLIYAVFKGSFWSNLIASHEIMLNIIFGILLSLIFPSGFIFGMIGSIVLFIKRRNLKE